MYKYFTKYMSSRTTKGANREGCGGMERVSNLRRSARQRIGKYKGVQIGCAGYTKGWLAKQRKLGKQDWDRLDPLLGEENGIKTSDISAENQRRKKTKPLWFWSLIKELSSLITWVSVTKSTKKHIVVTNYTSSALCYCILTDNSEQRYKRLTVLHM